MYRTVNVFCEQHQSGTPLEKMPDARGGQKSSSFPFGMIDFVKPSISEPWKGQRLVLCSYLGLRYVTGGGGLAFLLYQDSNGHREVIRGGSFRIREVVQFDVQALWPFLSGVRPNDPSVVPPFVDPREALEGEPRGEEGVLDDDLRMFSSPPQDSVPAALAAALAAPAASSADAEPSAGAPVYPAPEYMNVDLRGDDDDQMAVNLLEDHCIHWYHQKFGMSLHLKTL